MSILFLMLPFVGCATPAPLVHLTPRTPDVHWVSGRPVMAKQSEDVRVAVAFEEQHHQLVGIRLEIENRRDERLEVGPADVTFVKCTGTSRKTCGAAELPVDPEQVLTMLDEEASRSRAEAENQQSRYVPLLLLSAVGDLGSGHGAHDTITVADSAALARVEHATELSRLEQQRAHWSSRALRRSTLLSGRAVAGIVYVPYDPKTHLVWLEVRAGERRFHFCFQQALKAVK